MRFRWTKKHWYIFAVGSLGAAVVLATAIPIIVDFSTINKTDLKFDSGWNFANNKYRGYAGTGNMNDAEFQSKLSTIPLDAWYNEVAFTIYTAIRSFGNSDIDSSSWKAKIYGLHTNNKNGFHLDYWSEITFVWPRNNYDHTIYKERLFFSNNELHSPNHGGTGYYRSDSNKHTEYKYMPFNRDWVQQQQETLLWIINTDMEASLIFSNITFTGSV
ncbi:MAG: hypothetical protein LBV37_02950 [Mycoplasmataceae bacterium]|jgi:hypothetical protein|nr:hypothetical protein [Mycoplasmataceae bacterium]